MTLRRGMAGLLWATVVLGTLLNHPATIAAADNTSRERIELNRLKRTLRPKGHRATSWYVLLLRDTTPKTIHVRYVLVQGQDHAAKAVYDFFQEPNVAYRDFACQAFRDNKTGRQAARAFYQSQIWEGMEWGAAPASAPVESASNR